MREFYLCLKNTTESAFEYGCQFRANKAFLEAHPDYNTFEDNIKKVLSTLGLVLDKKEKFLAFYFITKNHYDDYKLLKNKLKNNFSKKEQNYPEMLVEA